MAGGVERGLELADWYMQTYPELLAAPKPDEDPYQTYRQIMAADAYALYGRFGDARQVAVLAEPDAGRPLMRVGWRYARGEAAARRGDAAAVRTEATAIADLLAQGVCYRMTHTIAFVRAWAFEDDPSDPVAAAQSAYIFNPSRERLVGAAA